MNDGLSFACIVLKNCRGLVPSVPNYNTDRNVSLETLPNVRMTDTMSGLNYCSSHAYYWTYFA